MLEWPRCGDRGELGVSVFFSSICIQAMKILFAKDRDTAISKQKFNEILYQEWIIYARAHESMMLRPGEKWTAATEARGVVKNKFDQMVMEENPQFDMKMLEVVRAVELGLIPRILNNSIDLEVFLPPYSLTTKEDINVAHAMPLAHLCRTCCRTYTSSLSISRFLFVHSTLILVGWCALLFPILLCCDFECPVLLWLGCCL